MQFRQRTIRAPISATGIGLHSGKKCQITFRPASVDSGVVFVRNGIKIPALSSFNVVTPLCTTLKKDGEQIRTIEHLMAALSCLLIDNIEIECSSDEIPIMDGSALPFIILLENEVIAQHAAKKFIAITRTTTVRQGDKWAKIEPFQGMSFGASIDFDHPCIGRSQFTYEVTNIASFKREVSRARTFGFLRDIEKLQSQNLILGGSVDNAIVLDDYGVVNEDGLRFEDEFARHKVVDAVGDLRLIGMNLLGRFTSHKTGHALNALLVEKVLTLGHFLVTSDPWSLTSQPQVTPFQTPSLVPGALSY